MDQMMASFTNLNWLIALAVMVSYIIIDALYARYTIEVVSLRPVMSAFSRFPDALSNGLWSTEFY